MLKEMLKMLNEACFNFSCLLDLGKLIWLLNSEKPKNSNVCFQIHKLVLLLVHV